MVDTKLNPDHEKITKALFENLQENVPFQDQKSTIDTSCEEIEFCMTNTVQFVPIGQHIHIDLVEAKSNTGKSDWTFRKNEISFISNRIGEYRFLTRTESDKWYVDTPIYIPTYSVFFWTSFVDLAAMEQLPELFFAEADWFSASSWSESLGQFEEVFSNGDQDECS